MELPACFCIRNTFIDDAPEDKDSSLSRNQSVPANFRFRSHTKMVAQKDIASHKNVESMQFLLDTSSIRLNTLWLDVKTLRNSISRDLNTINECHDILNTLLQLENSMRFLYENLTTVMVFQLPRACDVCQCGLETMSQYLGVDITFLKYKLQHVKSKISIQWLVYALRDHLGTPPVALLIISQDFEKVAYIHSNF